MSDALHIMTKEGYQVTDDQIAMINAEVNYDLIKKNQYDKFGDGEYISVDTVKEILNETFNYTWSWEIVEFFDKGDFVVCQGRLSIPGVGVRDGIGQAKADKKDNSTMYSSAASFAFKNAAKSIGIAKNIFNKEGMGYEIFEPGTVVKKLKPQMHEAAALPAQQNTVTMPEKQQVESTYKTPNSVGEKAKELKEAYQLSSKKQFVAFTQIWNPEITEFSQITEDVIEQLHAYAEENPGQFEDFRAEDYN